MTPDALADFCLSLPQAIETFPFGEETSVFKTSGNGKIFALSALAGEPFTVSLKCDPDESRALREEFPKQITPGYHLNKKHWITIMLDEHLDDALVEQLLRDSHALVRPKTPRAREAGVHPVNPR
ncbi:MmcQ/YjbR family DNA-binding protein [Cryobacterium sinapicolor]|uniref:MmcQ/YjbR family DNA-binding protein n=1 Tax=Cryobacterium sinapicolor TaxID=1259236 RepID=A0ABY2J3J3_9MICO|nr:MmcQ/YjbR family DNA-binding protein [Cryobacterium sinapicolor]TFC99501.1 MmcQ/YjbR family DNA-binding protein [Cryobacterium sinapicolor]